MDKPTIRERLTENAEQFDAIITDILAERAESFELIKRLELVNICSVDSTSDQSISIVFTSCRSKEAFIKQIAALKDKYANR